MKSTKTLQTIVTATLTLILLSIIGVYIYLGMRAAVPSEEVAPLVNVPAASLREVAGPESAALDNEASALPTDDRFNILESLGTQPEISVGEDGYTPVSNPPPTVVETPTAADRLNILNRLSAEAEIVPE